MEFKDKDQLVEEAFNYLRSNLKFDIDDSAGEPLRTFIEAIANQLSKMYWQLEQNYNSAFVDGAYGEELTSLVKLLGTNRIAAVKATGSVIFYRETPADVNYVIPVGTLVETLPDEDGNSIRFETTENVTLLQGQSEVSAPITAVEPGLIGNITANKIIVINNPPAGIESVKNISATIGGRNEESDDALRERIKSYLDSKGNATIEALRTKIAAVPGINSVFVNDMARGIGTVDVLVLGDVLPLPQSKINELNNIIASTKSGGIDIILAEPTTKSVNVSITLTLENNVTLNDVLPKVNEAIDKYFNSLSIGETFYKNQLSKEVLNSHAGILDINISLPSGNVTATAKEIIVKGTITIG